MQKLRSCSMPRPTAPAANRNCSSARSKAPSPTEATSRPSARTPAINLKALSERGIDAWICDNQYRSRDPRYAGQEAHKVKPDPLWDKSKKEHKTKCFRPQDFRRADDHSHCICPAGKRLYSEGADCTIGGRKASRFCKVVRDCLPCALRGQCPRKPDTTKARHVAFLMAKRSGTESYTDRMKRRIDLEEGKRLIAARFATVAQVFGNLRHNKLLTRFTLRGKGKVDGQWELYYMGHNVEKLAYHGYAG